MNQQDRAKCPYNYKKWCVTALQVQTNNRERRKKGLFPKLNMICKRCNEYKPITVYFT